MRYHGAVIRPPSEASSLIAQVTYGCSNDTCDFCGTYLDKPFGVRQLDTVRGTGYRLLPLPQPADPDPPNE